MHFHKLLRQGQPQAGAWIVSGRPGIELLKLHKQRYAILVCFLQKVLADLRDTTVEMLDDLITRVFRRSERDQDEETVQAAPGLNRLICNYRTVAKVLLDPNKGRSSTNAICPTRCRPTFSPRA